jgi:membrane fusion protein (multidrug efflux system)
MNLIVQSPLKAFVLALLLSSLIFMGTACSKGGNADNGDPASEEVTAEDPENGQNDDNSETEGVPVEVTRVATGKISSYILLSSTIETESRVDVYSQTAGLVDEILVEEGDLVRKASILSRLDDEEYSLEEAKAEVSFHKLENDFKRIEKMYQDELISVEDYENARYELRYAELEWKKANLLLKYTRIEAPISGVVSERLVNTGDRITTSTKIFSIVNLNSMIAVVHVPEREIDRIKIDQDVMISSDFLQDEQIEGWVKRISPVVDPNSGTFKVTVGLKSNTTNIRPGMFVNVHIVTGTHDDALLVPRDAIVYDGGREYIFLAAVDSTAVRIELEKGFSNNQTVEVLSGVSGDDHVIVVGQSSIKDGSRIKILEEEDTGGGEEAS